MVDQYNIINGIKINRGNIKNQLVWTLPNFNLRIKNTTTKKLNKKKR